MMGQARPRLDPQEEAERWFARLLAPDCTQDERQAFESWLHASPDHQRAYAATERMWSQLGEAVQDPEIESLPEAVVVEPRTSSRRRPLTWRLAWGAAAAAAVILLAAGTWYLAPLLQPLQHYETARGETRTATLPDGSRITLDAQSHVAVRFTRQERHVQVERGTALFEVTGAAEGDEPPPFVVTTRLGSATVLGTRFQVQSADDRTEVILLEGSLQLGSREPVATPIVLRPGERAVLASHQTAWAVSTADVEAATSWQHGRLIFRATPLAQALEQMNRYTSRQLRLGDPALADLRISGVFRAGDVESFTLALQHSYALHARDLPNGERVLSRTPDP